MAWHMRLFALLLAAGSIALVSGEASCSVQDSSSQSPHGSLLQVRRNSSATLSSVAQVDSHIGSQPAGENKQAHVCILARTCGPHTACAPGPGDPTKIVQAFLASMVAQAYISWELHLLNSQGGPEVFTDIIANLGDQRLSSGPNSPDVFSSNSWGYEATNYALGKMFEENVACEYFLFTNADNLYARGFLETGLPGMLSGLDLLGFNFVTRYMQPSTLREHMPMADAGFQLGHIDLGAVLVSANAMKESGIRFSPENGEITDWKFFEAILQRANGKGSTFYPELHYIHQLLQVNSSEIRDPQASHGASLLQEVESPAVYLQASAQAADRSTLFYHIHVPRTGGTTVANLLAADICSPHDTDIKWAYEGDHSLCRQACTMGLTDNLLTCADERRLALEHSAFTDNFQRAKGLLAQTGAQKLVLVTTLRRGSDRVKSQWALEVFNKLWLPPAGIPALSDDSLQLYLAGGNHTGKGWSWSVQTPSQRNNAQVAQLASIDPLYSTVVTRWHLDKAKQVLLEGEWLIGFTNCLGQVHQKLNSYAESLHGVVSEKVNWGTGRNMADRPLGHEAAQEIIKTETLKFLDMECVFDNELFDWAWDLASRKADPRFTETC